MLSGLFWDFPMTWCTFGMSGGISVSGRLAVLCLSRIRRMRTWRRSICVNWCVKPFRLVRAYLDLAVRCSNSPCDGDETGVGREKCRASYSLRCVRIRSAICFDRRDVVTQSVDFVGIKVQRFELSSVAGERRDSVCWNSSPRNSRREFGNIRKGRRWMRYVIRRVRTVDNCNVAWLTVCRNCRRSRSNISIADVISRRLDSSSILRVATNTGIVLSGEFSSHKRRTRRIVEITELLTEGSSF
jgi:hypothetical protein